MKIILLGPPGVGKGTQAKLLATVLKVPVISTGDMLRAAIIAESKLGQAAQHYMDAGQLVPDDLIIDLVKVRINEPDCGSGFILDGFPRTLEQAQALSLLSIQMDAVIALKVDDSVIVDRLSGRRLHPPSGRVYHIHYQPPQQPGLDDVTQEPLIQREDDEPETVLARLKVYHAQTAPVLQYYRNFHSKPIYTEIDAQGSIESISDSMIAVLGAESI
ncbi:MAG: adenylate kinase [Legionellales bacterium]|nr:adenylate kinase [Legionellales bacterium]